MKWCADDIIKYLLDKYCRAQNIPSSNHWGMNKHLKIATSINVAIVTSTGADGLAPYFEYPKYFFEMASLPSVNPSPNPCKCNLLHLVTAAPAWKIIWNDGISISGPWLQIAPFIITEIKPTSWLNHGKNTSRMISLYLPASNVRHI